ncbi:MAG: TAXI family TRAP transporter solute-binding subunit [Akkermansiaceae bacterium]
MLLFLAVAVLILLAGRWAGAWKSREYTVGSGKPGAGYGEFVTALVEVGEKKKVGLKLSAVESEGSVQNMQMLERGEVDFGLVQEGVEFADNVRVVAAVYSDTVHILVRKGAEIKSVSDFKNRRVSLGLKSSGTRLVALNLLEHYAVTTDELDEQILEPREAVKALVAGNIDAMVMVTAMRAPMIREALATGQVTHLSLGVAAEPAGIVQGISSRFPHLKPSVIPRHAYGISKTGEVAMPSQAVSVLSVPSLLVCRDDIPDAAVNVLTRALFSNRHALGKRVPSAMDIREPNDVNDLSYPVHEGAEEYYRRKDPGFLVVYAEVIALLLSGVIAVVGLFTGIRRWITRRRKNRIDVYYGAINASLKGLEKREITNFEQEERKLIDLKHSAFDELINERLTADESFRIFQDLLEQCLQEVKRQSKEANSAQ